MTPVRRVQEAPQKAIDILHWVVPLLAIAAGLGIRLFLLGQTSNYMGADPPTRAMLAEHLLQDGALSLYKSTVWPPLHFVVLAISNLLVDNRELAARLPCVLAGGLAAGPAFLIGSRLARWGSGGNAGLGLVGGSISSLVVALEPLGIAYSMVSFSEPLASLFILCGLAALAPCGANGASRGPRWGWFFFWLALTNGLRYESWGLASLFLLARDRSMAWRLGAGLLSIAPSLCWVILRPGLLMRNAFVKVDWTDALPSLAPERLDALSFYFERANELLAVWPGASAFPLGVVGLAWAFRRSGGVPLAAATTILLGTLVGTTICGHVPGTERYLQTPILLWSLCAASGLTCLIGMGGQHRVLAIPMATGAVLLVGGLARAGSQQALEYPFENPPGLYEMTQRLEAAHNRAPDQLILIDPLCGQLASSSERAVQRPEGGVNPSDSGGQLEDGTWVQRAGRPDGRCAHWAYYSYWLAGVSWQELESFSARMRGQTRLDPRQRVQVLGEPPLGFDLIERQADPVLAVLAEGGDFTTYLGLAEGTCRPGRWVRGPEGWRSHCIARARGFRLVEVVPEGRPSRQVQGERAPRGTALELAELGGRANELMGREVIVTGEITGTQGDWGMLSDGEGRVWIKSSGEATFPAGALRVVALVRQGVTDPTGFSGIYLDLLDMERLHRGTR